MSLDTIRASDAPPISGAGERCASEALHCRRHRTAKAVPRTCRRSASEATLVLPLVGSGGTLLVMTKTALRDELRKLSLAERLELVEELWDSIAADCEREPFPLSDAQRADLEQRLAEADADPAGGAPWGEVRERIRQRPR